MNMRYIPTVVALSACLLLTACRAPRRSNYVTTRAIHAVDASQDADAMWTTIQDTLREDFMPLDRVDRAAGVMTTIPVMSQHWFEFWRHDVATRRDALESTLNPIRRWVEVHVGFDDARNWTRLTVVVHKQRLSSPDRQFNSSGAAYQYFGNSLPSTTGKPTVSAKDDRWIDIGTDPAMEEFLLNKMLDRLGLPAAGKSQRNDTGSKKNRTQ